MVIGSELVDAANGETFETVNPATAEALALLPAGGSEDVDRAVAAASAAQSAWIKRSPSTRERALEALAVKLEEHLEDLVRLESLDVGKPIAQMRAVDARMALEGLRYHAGMAGKVEGRTIPTSRRYLTLTRREPVGVVAGIIPWNFPLMGMLGKLAPALAAGNAVVVKPSPLAPLTSLAVGRLALEAGLPPGLVNVVTDSGSAAGEALVRHPGVGHVSFTGSPGVGRKVAAAAGESLKSCTCELGGKSPLIVFADADLEAAANAAFFGIFLNQGEMCTAASRLLVERSAHAQMLEAVVAAAGTLKLGDPLDEATSLGPLVSAAHRERVEGYVAEGRDSGAELACGGGRPADSELSGFFFLPTVFDRVPPDSTIAREEIFGPVLSVIPFEDEGEALAIANATRYGLGAGVFTSRVDRALRFVDGLRAGNVWVNAYNLLHPAVPFGGIGDSGFGKEGGFSGMEAMTREKAIWLGA
jgi:acyl-CoA reductase-like NAD-dependent aldehyde dehydrogenase